MSGSTEPVLYIRHSALEGVDPNNVEIIRKMWSSFSRAKESISQGARLEYMSWRLYSRQIMNVRENSGGPDDIPDLNEPPGLEMSSSTESMSRPGNPRKLSNQSIMTLFDEVICTNPGTPCKEFAAVPMSYSAISPVEVPQPRDQPSDSGKQEVTGSLPDRLRKKTPEVKPVRSQINLARPQPVAVPFDKVSVASRSSASVSTTATTAASSCSVTGTHGVPSAGDAINGGFMKPTVDRSRMFFIESGSDSECGSADSQHVSGHHAPPAVGSALRRGKSVTFTEPANHSDSSDYETEDENAGSSGEWDESDWDDMSEDEEPLFAERAVPTQPQLRHSLLSRLFKQDVSPKAAPAPRPASSPVSPPSPEEEAQKSGSQDALSQSSDSYSCVFECAIQTKNRTQNPHEHILLNAGLSQHVPITSEPTVSSSITNIPKAASVSNTDLYHRELSQSVREHLHRKRQYDLDTMYKSQRPNLNRSSTTPNPTPSYHAEEDNSYHARGW